MNPADVQGTAMAAAMTMISETQAAIPTATLIPPTEIPSATPIPTNTIAPLGLVTPTSQAFGVLPTGQAVLPTYTSVPSSSASSDPCNQPLTKWEGESVKISVANNTKPQGTIILSYWVNTGFGECGYVPANSNSFYAPMGAFSAGAFVDSNKDYKVFGGGVINRPGNYTLQITNDSITLK
jgi:hypothetical protein